MSGVVELLISVGFSDAERGQLSDYSSSTISCPVVRIVER